LPFSVFFAREGLNPFVSLLKNERFGFNSTKLKLKQKFHLSPIATAPLKEVIQAKRMHGLFGKNKNCSSHLKMADP